MAAPALDDPNFELSVVYMLEDADEGALGVVLNRPSELPVSGTFETWLPYAAAPAVVFLGGPVSHSSVIAIAAGSAESTHPGWNAVAGDLGTVDLDSDPDEHVGLRHVRMFGGYSSWAPGQLEGELADDAWFVVDADPGDIHTATPDQLWWSVMARQSDELRMLRHYPREPWNN